MKRHAVTSGTIVIQTVLLWLTETVALLTKRAPRPGLNFVPGGVLIDHHAEAR